MLAARAQKLGFRWKTGLGLCRLGTNEQVLEIVAGESEEEIFAALDMAWVPPAMREIRP
jgi:DNA polymerase/3'-5' exonuclease PolX